MNVSFWKSSNEKAFLVFKLVRLSSNFNNLKLEENFNRFATDLPNDPKPTKQASLFLFCGTKTYILKERFGNRKNLM